MILSGAALFVAGPHGWIRPPWWFCVFLLAAERSGKKARETRPRAMVADPNAALPPPESRSSWRQGRLIASWRPLLAQKSRKVWNCPRPLEPVLNATPFSPQERRRPRMSEGLRRISEGPAVPDQRPLGLIARPC